MKRIEERDIVIVGAGIAGLSTAYEFTKKGYKPLVIEQNPLLSHGTTSRNGQVWHAGFYHSAAIDDQVEALRVAESVRSGHDRFMDYAPECITSPHMIAAFTTSENAEFAVQRWEMAGLRPQPITSAEFRSAEPYIDDKKIATAFYTEDKIIDGQGLSLKLANDIVKNSGCIIRGVNFRPVDSNHADIINKDGSVTNLTSDLFVVTAGIGIQTVFENTTTSIPMRYFKAHTLYGPQLVKSGVYVMEPTGVVVVNVDGASTINRNRMNRPVEKPDYDIVEEDVRLIQEAALPLFPTMNLGNYTPFAAIKPEFVTDQSADTIRLGYEIKEPVPNYVCAIPGKATEALLLAEDIVAMIENRGLQPKNSPRGNVVFQRNDITRGPGIIDNVGIHFTPPSLYDIMKLTDEVVSYKCNGIPGYVPHRSSVF